MTLTFLTLKETCCTRRSRLRPREPQRDSLLAAEAGRWLPASFTLSSAPQIKPTCWSAAAYLGTKFLVSRVGLSLS